MWMLASMLYLLAAGLASYLMGRLIGLKKNGVLHLIIELLFLTAVTTSSAVFALTATNPKIAGFFLMLFFEASTLTMFGTVFLFLFLNDRFIVTIETKFTRWSRYRKPFLFMFNVALVFFLLLMAALFPLPENIMMKSSSGWWYNLNETSRLTKFILLILSESAYLFIFFYLINISSRAKGFLKQELKIAMEFASVPAALTIFAVIGDNILDALAPDFRPFLEALIIIIGLIIFYYLFFVKHVYYRYARYRLPRFFEILGQHAPALAVIDLENESFISSTAKFKDIIRFVKRRKINATKVRTGTSISNQITNNLFTYLKSTKRKYHHGKRMITYDEPFSINNEFYQVVLHKIPNLDLYLISMTNVTRCENLNTHLQQYINDFNLFISTAFHELGNALQPILGFMEILKEEVQNQITKDELITDAMDTIERNVFRLKELLQLFRLIGKNQANFLDVDLEVINLTQILKETVHNYESQAKIKGIALHVDLPPEEIYVLGDRTYLPITIVNILSNALKFTPSGGQVSIRLCTPRHCPVDLPLDRSQVCLEISDTGIGIDPEEMEIIINPFKRGKTSKSAFDMGLGMYITNEIVKKHGGRLEIISNGRNKGTTIRMYLLRAHP